MGEIIGTPEGSDPITLGFLAQFDHLSGGEVRFEDDIDVHKLETIESRAGWQPDP